MHSLAVMRGRRRYDYDDVVFVRYSMAVAYLPDGACRKADRGDELEMFETVERLTVIRGRMIGISEGWVVLDNNGGPEGLADGIRSNVLGRS